MSEQTKAERIRQLMAEIGQRQSELHALVLGDPRESVQLSAAPTLPIGLTHCIKCDLPITGRACQRVDCPLRPFS